LTLGACAKLSAAGAFAAELIGTAMLLWVVFCVTDGRNKARPRMLTALTIGLTVTMLVSLLGPLTMACLNPARDLAPRLFSSLAGWNRVPFTVNGSGWLTVYVTAPILGGVAGGAIHTFFFKKPYLSSK
jgi:glycerol uptake facilitator protein